MTRDTETRNPRSIRQLVALVAVAALAVFGSVARVGAQNYAAVQFDAQSGPVHGSVSNGGTLTLSHTVGTQTHPWLVVGVALNNSFYNGYSVLSVTWVVGSTTQALSRVQGEDNTTHLRRVEQWDLDTPTSGSGTITVTFTVPSGTVAAIVGAVSLWNVTSRGPNACDTPIVGQESATPHRSVSTTYIREGAVDFYAVPGDITRTAVGARQTERWNDNTGSSSSDLYAGGSTQPSLDDTTTFQWTVSGSTSWTICALDLRPFSPTLAHMREYSALPTARGTVIRWQTSYEVDNLGFRLFREAADGSRIKVTPSLIAGSALFAGQGTALRAGRSYQWLDTASNGGGSGRYWLEEVSLDGLSTLHGPILPERGAATASTLSSEPAVTRNSVLLSAVGVAPASATPASSALRRVVRSANANLTAQWQLAGMSAARIGVREEGWYRIGKADLLAAGFDPGDDPAALRLFNGGVVQAISVVPGQTGSFDAEGYIEFYGTGLDTPSTDTNVYWLVKDAVGAQAAKRIQMADRLTGSPAADSYLATVERRDRTVYFAALLDTTRDNFFGPTITGEAAEQVLTLDRISPKQTPAPTLEVAVQGATTSAHRVSVSLNGHTLGEVDFSGVVYKTATLGVDPSFLLPGSNSVKLVALGDSTDVSLVDYVRLGYQRLLYADSDTVNLAASPLQAVTVKGFTTPHVRVIDVSQPSTVVELPGQVARLTDGYAITATPVPVYQSMGPQPPVRQNLLFAFTEEQAKQPAWIEANSPSQWHGAGNSADLVIITHHDFKGAAGTLAEQRASQGLVTRVIDVQDAYDEFSYGAKDPQAIRDLLARAKATWQRAPRFVLLLGDATSDPRNYLGDAMLDFVPTKMVPLEVLKSASDDWFVDFNDTGYPQIAIGRIPVQTAAEAATVVGKLVQYDSTAAGAGWTKSGTFISDTNDPTLRVAFTDETHTMEQHVPTALGQDEILVGSMDLAAARSAILSALDTGSLLVTYVGHGGDTSWSTSNLFTAADAAALSNGAQLPVLSTLNCLNGLFEDPSTDSLAEALLKAPAGGAVAVLASSSLTDAEPQLLLGTRFYDALFASTGVSLGEALMTAKTSDVKESVRQSFLLFGDPSMKLRK